MSKEIQSKLDEVKTNFDKTQEAAKKLQEQVNAGNRQLKAYNDVLIGLQGEAKALSELLPKEEHVVETEEHQEKKPKK